MLPLTPTVLSPVRLIATDMDGTLTENGQFTSELLMALESLVNNNINILIVTGRSAGWVNAIANYLPIAGAIAENGGLYYSNQNNTVELITNLDDVEKHRGQLKQIFQLLQSKFPQIKESIDNSFRLTDWTFDIGALTPKELQIMEDICQDAGYGFTYSTVQCHIKPQQQDKALGLKHVIQKYFPGLTQDQVVTVGDSPNDESLFNQDLFPLSVGVANIAHYSDCLLYQPTYITSLPEVQGFCQLVDLLTK